MNIDFSKISKNEVKELALEKLMEVKHSTISTIDFNGNPTSRIVDLMFREGDDIYILTCNVKPFYRQIKHNKNIAITVMTKDYLQVRVQGICEEVGEDILQKIVEKNPSIKELGLVRKDLNNMSYFCITKIRGEIFDLSGERVKAQRARFSYGNKMVNEAGCVITNRCINCGKCFEICPFKAITKGKKKYIISSNLCDECGLCYYICPVKAIELPTGM